MPRALTPLLLAAVALAGCSSAPQPVRTAFTPTPTNQQHILGDPLSARDQVVLPSIGRGPTEVRTRVRARDMAGRIIRPSIPAPAATPREDSTDDAPPEPSITSFDRTDWPEIRFNVPNDRTEHQPRYTNLVRYDRTSPRARGDHPTFSSALDTATSKSADQQIKEAFAGPITAGIDVILFPVRVFMTRPWQTTRTGFDRYQRFPQERTVVPDGLLPVIPDEAPQSEPETQPEPESADPAATPSEPRP